MATEKFRLSDHTRRIADLLEYDECEKEAFAAERDKFDGVCQEHIRKWLKHNDLNYSKLTDLARECYADTLSCEDCPLDITWHSCAATLDILAAFLEEYGDA